MPGEVRKLISDLLGDIEQDDQHCFHSEVRSLHHTFEREHGEFGQSASISLGVGGQQDSTPIPIHVESIARLRPIGNNKACARTNKCQFTDLTYRLEFGVRRMRDQLGSQYFSILNLS